MHRSPTMKDVARHLGVSVMTVSRAFRADTSVSEETRIRTLSAAEAMGYVFDARASNLRSQRSGFVAVTVPSINNANFADTVGALAKGLEGAGLQVLLGATQYDETEEERLIGQLLRRRPEAILVTGGLHTARARQLLSNARIPVVETWDLPTHPIGHVVGFSNASAMALMVDHLIAKGYRRIGFVGGEAGGDRRGTDRRRGFIAAMQSRGLPADRLSAAARPPITMQDGADAAAAFLSRHPDSDAIVFVSDLSAFGGLTECARRGIRVPDDIAIAGFGFYDVARVCVPTITTIDPHAAEIGSRAASLIAELVAGPPRPERRIVQVTPTLAQGASA
jgi:LacI family transcriptional regulator, gluconate utilization system Gnt-I transcriptional repressor